jgi:hypothetical protein
MRSVVGDELRAAQRAREARLTPGERVRLALELGRRDLVVYATAHGLGLVEAYRRLRAAAQAGRAPSGVMSDLARTEP